jgi:hypothetical protein
MSLNATQIYALLPAIYRIRDTENGQPLLALCTVIAEQATIVEENIRQLYDDAFIETCASWVVPYIADLVGCDAIYEIGAIAGTRAEVANTIGYRRRKGTLLALEQVALDVSGMPAAAVEFFKRIITTESMRHVQPHHEAWLNLRKGLQLERLDTAFDTINRTVDVRRIAPRNRIAANPDATPLEIDLHGGGRFNIPDVGVYLWRWQYFPVEKARAFAVDGARYMFSPLGQDMPLFNALPARDSFSRETTRLDVPQPILRRELNHDVHHELGEFYGVDKSITIYADGVAVPTSRVCCRNLSDTPGDSWGCTASGRVAIDPVLGRIQFAPNFPAPGQVQVSYSYGFPGQRGFPQTIGGGSYDRSPGLSSAFEEINFSYTAVVGSGTSPTLEAAIALWNSLPPGSTGLIVLPGFKTLDVDLTGAAAIVLPPQSQLWIVSAQTSAAGGAPFTFSDCFTVLRGDIQIQAQQPAATESGVLNLNMSGVWISGSVQIVGSAAVVQFVDCTLVPGISLQRDGRATEPGNASIVVSATEVSLQLVRCISGPVGAAVGGSTRICSSIIDSGSRCGVAYAGPDMNSEGCDLHIEDSTVIGKVRVRTLELASNTIFFARLACGDPWAAALWCTRQQAGCVRFCFIPAASIVPKRFRCLPPDPSQEDLFLPRFVSLRYGDPSYGLLSDETPMAVWKGADNGSQMGVYYFLKQTEGVSNAQIRAPEYVPFGLEAGVFLEPSRSVPPAPRRRGYGSGYGYAREDEAAACEPCEQGSGEDVRFVSIGAGLI